LNSTRSSDHRFAYLLSPLNVILYPKIKEGLDALIIPHGHISLGKITEFLPAQ
jgi:hypothetical protein